MTNPSDYEKYDPLETTPLLHWYGDIAAHWPRAEATVEDVAAAIVRDGFTLENPSDPTQIIEKLTPAETASPSDGPLGGEYTQPLKGFGFTTRAYEILACRGLSQEIPPVPLDEPSVE